MSYNYSAYADDDNNQATTGSSDSDSDSGSDTMNLTMVPHAAIEADIVKVFGNENAFGQSLGVRLDNIELVDGCLYYDSDKNKYKVFPWKDVVGISPEENPDLTADDANDYLVKNYATTEKRYELVEAVVPEKDDAVEIGDAVLWYSGSQDNGPKAAARTLTKIFAGREMVIELEDYPGSKEDWINGWLSDTSADNCLRDDLQDRRVAFFEVKKDSNQSDRQYHHPVIVDTQTGKQVIVQNATDTTSQPENTESSEPEPSEPEPAPDTMPAPVEDFVSTCNDLGFTDRERARQLLTDLVADEGNDLTANVVSSFGGEDAILDEIAE
jgi:hypothetical protein